jgi:hypothetical protein
MLRIVVLAGILALVASLSPAALAQNAGIVPGLGIGSYRIGDDAAPVVSSLGPLHSEDDLAGGSYRGYFWPLKRIGVIVNTQTKKIAAVALSLDDTLQTEKGIAVGTEMDQIRAAYGKEESVDSHEDDDTLVYNDLGVAFVVDKSGALGGRISVIFVFHQGDYHHIFQASR